MPQPAGTLRKRLVLGVTDDAVCDESLPLRDAPVPRTPRHRRL